MASRGRGVKEEASQGLMMRRIDEDINELAEAWSAMHPDDDEERRGHPDPLKPKRAVGQPGADHVFSSMTRYRTDCPGTR